jgi:hypothetical protein
MTLGPAMIALAFTENVKGRVAGWIEVYGRVPMFYYVFHIVAAHLVGMALAGIQGGVLMRIPVFTAPDSIPSWYGVGLPGVYLAWAIVVIAMYWPCRWFGNLKARSSSTLIQYL